MSSAVTTSGVRGPHWLTVQIKGDSRLSRWMGTGVPCCPQLSPQCHSALPRDLPGTLGCRDSRTLLPAPRGCPCVSEHLPCDSRSQGLATPVPLTAVFICQQEAGRKGTRAGRGGKRKKREQEGQERRKRESESSTLPSGLAVLTTFPDVLFIPEIIIGGLVWILVASSKVPYPMLQGWVMFVSVFCFVMSISLLCLYLCGAHGGGSCWVALDAICQCTAALFYLSAAVLEAYTTYSLGLFPILAHQYRENIAAVVFAFVATLLYVIHKVFSLLRWKSS